MKNTYTEEEIKKWFEIMMAKYPNSNILQDLENVKSMMFDKTLGDKNLLKNVINELRELNHAPSYVNTSGIGAT